MSDHENYCNKFSNEIDIVIQDVDSLSDKYVIVEEKSGDEFLIELYRKQSLLYDKNDPNFKDKLMKRNAWTQISNAMIASNYGDRYTPDYCHKRCTTLREQYNREKKRIESQSKSGSSSSPRKLSFYSQLAFLDEVIKRRRSRSSITKFQSNITLVGKHSAETNKSDDVSTYSSIKKENQKTNYKQTDDVKNSYQEISIYYPKLKKRKVTETKELEQNLLSMSNRIVNSKETLKPYTADDAFMEFIKIQFDSIPEHEKYIRRKLMIDALSAPLPE